MNIRLKQVLFFCTVIPVSLNCLEDRYMLSGEGKVRFRNVDASSEQISGLYGEDLKLGLSFRQRFDLSLDIFLTEYLTVGGTVRISNEDSEDVLPPPDLVSTTALAGWWSVNFFKNPFDISLGAYETSFTPLTLMRWDQEDNPLGAAGCGCQVAVAGISGESLEELRADYRLEGARAQIHGRIGDITALYARPGIASEPEMYTRHMFGARARLVLPYARNFTNLTIGITLLRAVDDTASIDQALYDPLQSDVVGFDLRIPLFWKLSCFAEYARSIRDDNLLSTVDPVRSENGFVAGLNIKSGDAVDAHALVLHLDPYFSPLYRALSYAKNRQGIRGSFTCRKIPLFSHMLNISLYAKLLREIKPTWNEVISEWHGSLTDFNIANAALSYALFNRWKAESSYEFRTSQRVDDPSTLADEIIDLKTHVLSLSLCYEFTLQSTIIVQYQFIKNIDGLGQDSYDAHVPMLQFSFKF